MELYNLWNKCSFLSVVIGKWVFWLPANKCPNLIRILFWREHMLTECGWTLSTTANFSQLPGSDLSHLDQCAIARPGSDERTQNMFIHVVPGGKTM